MRPNLPIRLALAALAVAALAGCKGADAGWTYAPAPSTTPAPTAGPSGQATAAPSTNGTVLKLVAASITFDQKTLEAPADTAFTIELDNQDAGVPHDVNIKDSSGAILTQDASINGVATKTYDIKALPAGTYTFYCSIHPIPAMTGTLTVK